MAHAALRVLALTSKSEATSSLTSWILKSWTTSETLASGEFKKQNFPYGKKELCTHTKHWYISRKKAFSKRSTIKFWQYRQELIPLHRVFHGIRFKVNKRLGLSGAPFFFALNSAWFTYDKEKRSLSQLNGLYTPFVLLPFGQWVFDKSPPFPGDRNPKGEGVQAAVNDR